MNFRRWYPKTDRLRENFKVTVNSVSKCILFRTHVHIFLNKLIRFTFSFLSKIISKKNYVESVIYFWRLTRPVISYTLTHTQTYSPFVHVSHLTWRQMIAFGRNANYVWDSVIVLYSCCLLYPLVAFHYIIIFRTLFTPLTLLVCQRTLAQTVHQINFIKHHIF